MGELQWMYIHGAWAWAPVLVLLALLGAAAARGRMALVAARRSKAAREQLIGASSSAETIGAEIVVRGRLVVAEDPPAAGAARVVAWTYVVDGERPIALPTAKLAVALEDGSIVLDGPLEIVAGSWEALSVAAGTKALDAWTGPAAREQTKSRGRKGRLNARALVAGDPVVARGILAGEPLVAGPGADRASYRTAPLQRKLVGNVRVASARRPRVLVRPRVYVLGAIAALAAGLGVLDAGGHAALALALASDAAVTGNAAGAPHRPPAATGTEISWLSLAAASPFSRHQALLQLAMDMRLDDADAEPRRRNGERVYEMLDSCADVVRIAARSDLARARSLAEACGVLGLAGSGPSFFAEGAFPVASVAFLFTPGGDDTLQAAMAHLAAHDYDDAAVSVNAFARAHESQADGPSRERAEALGCIANALGARDSNSYARGQLLAAVPHRAMCRVLYADLVHGEERRTVLHPAGYADEDWVWPDNQGMDFAKSWVLPVAFALHEEELGPLSAAHYDYALFPDAALASKSWESTHRSSNPVGLFAALDAKTTFVPGVDNRYCETVRGNLALFLATTGARDQARALARTIPDAKTNGIDPVLDVLDAHPERASRWSMPSAGYEGGLYAAMDSAVASTGSDPEAAHKTVDRFRAAILDRDITVPLQMLEAFAER